MQFGDCFVFLIISFLQWLQDLEQQQAQQGEELKCLITNCKPFHFDSVDEILKVKSFKIMIYYKAALCVIYYAVVEG